MSHQIQLLEGLLESWSEYENNVQCLKMWFETQEKRLKQQQRIGDQAAVHNAMKDCQVLGLSGPCSMVAWQMLKEFTVSENQGLTRKKRVVYSR